MSNVILFDIDHTLINTDQLFMAGFHPAIYEATGRPAQEVQPILDRYWQQFQRPELFEWRGYEHHLVTELGLTPEVAHEILYNPVFYQASLYPEVGSTMGELEARGYVFGVRSEGDPEFQRLKLELSGLLSHFDPELLYIDRDKNRQEAIAVLPESSLIDDRLTKLTPLLAEERLLPIWLNRRNEVRPPEWQQQPMITNLTEVLDFL